MTVRTPHVVKEDKHWLNPPEWWKKFRPLRWLAILTILGGLGSGIWGAKEIVMAPRPHAETEQYRVVLPDGIRLGGVFSSYSSVEQITAQLTAGSWIRIENHLPPSENYPPRDLDKLVVENYQHLDQPGKLSLEFFNNRLMEMYFEPRDAGAYSDALYASDRRLKKDRIGKADFKDGNLRLATNVELASNEVGRSLRTKPYAIWQDLRLLRQREQWEAAYGAVPVPLIIKK